MLRHCINLVNNENNNACSKVIVIYPRNVTAVAGQDYYTVLNFFFLMKKNIGKVNPRCSSSF